MNPEQRSAAVIPVIRGGGQMGFRSREMPALRTQRRVEKFLVAKRIRPMKAKT
jgi:hypothetical protein